MKAIRLLQLRFRQIYRGAKAVGMGNLVLLLPLIFLFGLFLLDRLQHVEQKNVLAGLYFFVVLVAHGKRKDWDFLGKIQVRKTLLFVLEYSLLCVPLSLFLLCLQLYVPIVLGHLAAIITALVLSLIPINLNVKKVNWKLGLLPVSLFEWKTTIRKGHFGLGLLWLLGAFMAINAFAYFLFVFLWAAFLPTTFKPTEGKELKPASKQQLSAKLYQNSVFLLLTLLPHFVVYLWFNGDYWFLPIAFAAYLLLFQAYCICYKYANYSQYREVANDVPALIFMLLCPFLPFSLFLLVRTYLQAQRNLN